MRYSTMFESSQRQSVRKVLTTDPPRQIFLATHSPQSLKGSCDSLKLHTFYGHTHIARMDQPGKVINPARGQLNKKKQYFPVRLRLKIWSRETGSAVPSRVSLLLSLLKLKLVLTYGIPPEFRDGVHLSI